MKAFLKSVLTTTLGMIIGSILSILLIIGIVSALIKSAQPGGLNNIEEKSVLHLHMSGQLVEKYHPLDFDLLGERSIFKDDGRIGLYEVDRAIDLAKIDHRISGIYLDLRDLEAGWASLSDVRRHLVDFAKSGKWIYAYANGYEEKTYYLATAANQIWLQPNGDMDFKGLGVSEMFFKGLLDKLGVEPRIFRVGKFKAAIEPFIRDKMSDENRKQTEELLTDVWKSFREATAKARNLPEDRIDQIASSLEAVSAQDAKKVGLVSDLMFEDQVEDKMAEASVGKDEDVRWVTVNQLLRDHRPGKISSGTKKIALLFADGEIGAGQGGRDSIGSDSMREDIEDARRDEDVAAIVVRINSPGGDALASDVIWRELMIADEEVPVIISMGDVAASGGYYIASAGRYVFAEPTTITGSIGVFGLMFGTEKLFRDKAGVHFDRAVTHPHADIGDMNRPMTELESQTIQNSVNRVYERFLAAVQEGRGFDKRDDVANIAEGRVWSGTAAKEIGLIDEIGGLREAIAKAAEYAELGDHYQIEIFPSDSDPLRHLVERLSGDATESYFARAGLTLPMVSMLKPFAALMHQAQGTLMVKPGVYARMPYDLNIH